MNAGDEKALLEISNHKKKPKNLKVKRWICATCTKTFNRQNS